MTTHWMWSHRHEGRVGGTYQSADGEPQEMVGFKPLMALQLNHGTD